MILPHQPVPSWISLTKLLAYWKCKRGRAHGVIRISQDSTEGHGNLIRVVNIQPIQPTLLIDFAAKNGIAGAGWRDGNTITGLQTGKKKNALDSRPDSNSMEITAYAKNQSGEHDHA